MPDELKECPNPSCTSKFDPICYHAGGLLQVRCRCGSSGPFKHSEEDAIAAWNALPRKQKWTTYDGTEETLPMYGKLTLVEAKHGAKFAVYSYDFEIGDRWMHWPEDNYVE